MGARANKTRISKLLRGRIDGAFGRLQMRLALMKAKDAERIRLGEISCEDLSFFSGAMASDSTCKIRPLTETDVAELMADYGLK